MKNIKQLSENKIEIDGKIFYRAKEIEKPDYSRQPVFPGFPKKGEICFHTNEVGKVLSWDWDPGYGLGNYNNGNCFTTDYHAYRYPINPGVTALLRIICRDYGGVPNDEDWTNIDFYKYGFFYNFDSNHLEKCKVICMKKIGAIYSLKKPDCSKIQDELGDLIKWFK